MSYYITLPGWTQAKPWTLATGSYLTGSILHITGSTDCLYWTHTLLIRTCCYRTSIVMCQANSLTPSHYFLPTEDLT